MRNDKLKIAYLETYTHVSGGQRGLLDLVQALDRDRFEAVVLLQGRGDLQKGLQALGVRTVLRRMEPFRNRWLPWSWLIGVGTVRRFLRDERPDVVHCNHPYVARYGARAAAELGIPCLVTLRSMPLREPQDRRNRRETMEMHDRIVSNSGAALDMLLSDFPWLEGKSEIIKNGIDLTRFHPAQPGAEAECHRKLGIPPGSLVVTQVGNMISAKGNEDLLNAFASLAPKHPRAHLVFVGGGFNGNDNSLAIRKQAEAAGIANRVHITGFLWDVREFHRHSNVTVLCSREREGLPRSLIEAMASGVPIIGTDVGGVRELVRQGQNGYLIPPSDVAALRSRLDTLFQDAALRFAMGGKGREIALARFSLQSMAGKYMGIYQSLAARPGKPAPSEGTDFRLRSSSAIPGGR